MRVARAEQACRPAEADSVPQQIPKAKGLLRTIPRTDDCQSVLCYYAKPFGILGSNPSRKLTGCSSQTTMF